MKKEIIILTKYKKQIEEELKELQNESRPEIIKLLREARALGDLSENAEYQAAKKRQGEIEGRIKKDKVRRKDKQHLMVVEKKKIKKYRHGVCSDIEKKNKSKKIVYK